MKWINAGERMPPNEFALPIICRRVGNNHSVISAGEFHARIALVEEINKNKIAEGQPTFDIDLIQFEWLDESPASEEDTAFVIYNSKYRKYLDRNEYFTHQIKNARTFTNKDDAMKSMNYYVKIYSKTNRRDTCDNLFILPVEIQISIKS
jgi:hypothetical protein